VPVCVAVVVARIALDAPIIALRLLVSAVAIALVDTTAPGGGSGVRRACPARRYRHCCFCCAVAIDPAKRAGQGTCRVFIRPRSARRARSAVRSRVPRVAQTARRASRATGRLSVPRAISAGSGCCSSYSSRVSVGAAAGAG
jgi:hypothetical protein